MNNRFKEIREAFSITQQQFAEKLNLSRNFVAQIEMGVKKPSERTIKDICREFSINEDWLRYGTGEMFKPQTKNQEIGSFANSVMELNDEKFKKRFVEALTRLDEKDWEALEKIAEKLLKEG